MAQTTIVKWDKQKIQIMVPSLPPGVEMDTINEVDYFEYIDDNFDFAFEMIKKGEEGFEYVKNLYEFALKELEKDEELDKNDFLVGKLEGLNSFYAITVDQELTKTGSEDYTTVMAELVFYSTNKKKLFYFDIEFDDVPMKFVEVIVKSIKFYE
ncbi:MAG: hypothetical protein KDC84_13475 [Crocinitomicaceae bacterium]|nr:hypothetical protein [Crocinitomicaceae bacterium]